MEAAPPAALLPSATGGVSGLRRVVLLRWFVIGLQLAAIVLAETLLGIHLQWRPMVLILALLAGFNIVSSLRGRAGAAAGEWPLFAQVCVDVMALTVLMYVAGGVTNPLISLYLPLIAVAATLLSGRLVAIVVALSMSGYSWVTLNYLPFALDNPNDAVPLHLAGMWLTFAFSAIIIAWFIVRMMQAIRERDARLAAAREAALRSERVVALGNLAAGAAHELGTPLATMAVLAGELLQHADLHPELREDVQLLRDQVAQCKGIITGLSARAGDSRAEGGQAMALDAWINAAIARWRALRPACSPVVNLEGPRPAPRVMADATLDQALANLFNNAADASPESVSIDAAWDRDALHLAVADRGRGIAPELAARLGREPVKTRDDGAGIGVLLACAAVERCGGQIRFTSREGGGTVATVHLPLKLIRID